jgi:hypothetical protein
MSCHTKSVCPVKTIKLLVRLQKFKQFWNQRIKKRVPFFLKLFLEFFSGFFFRFFFVNFFRGSHLGWLGLGVGGWVGDGSNPCKAG